MFFRALIIASVAATSASAATYHYSFQIGPLNCTRVAEKTVFSDPAMPDDCSQVAPMAPFEVSFSLDEALAQNASLSWRTHYSHEDPLPEWTNGIPWLVNEAPLWEAWFDLTTDASGNPVSFFGSWLSVGETGWHIWFGDITRARLDFGCEDSSECAQWETDQVSAATMVSAPIPAAGWMLLAALGGLGLLRWRRRVAQ